MMTGIIKICFAGNRTSPEKKICFAITIPSLQTIYNSYFEKFFTKKCSLSGILRQLKITVWTNETHCAIFYPQATHRVAISGTTGSYEHIAQNLNY